jgi:sterol desaturase/sphingolipid hydroxylase (fatty acid hydroxylase superfamily)
MIVNIYTTATPIILLLTLCEIFYTWKKKKDFYQFHDSVGSLSTAIINQIVNICYFALAIPIYTYLYDNFSLFNLNKGYHYILCFFLIDFLFYWFHRFGHTVNILWASHVSHHSSTQMNYLATTRTGIFQRTLSIIFYWPLACLGFPPYIIVPMLGLNLVLQFWQHTKAIDRLPKWFESIFNSPSHHRVHHGINQCYIDKNFAGVLIIWDKLFGTFAEEVEPVQFGVKKQIYDHSFHAINNHHIINIKKSLSLIKGVKNKVRFLFGGVHVHPDIKLSSWFEAKDPVKLSFFNKGTILLDQLLSVLFISYFLGTDAQSFSIIKITCAFSFVLLSTFNWATLLSNKSISLFRLVITYSYLLALILWSLRAGPHSFATLLIIFFLALILVVLHLVRHRFEQNNSLLKVFES